MFIGNEGGRDGGNGERKGREGGQIAEVEQ